jgi:hypothetical protein
VSGEDFVRGGERRRAWAEVHQHRANAGMAKLV